MKRPDELTSFEYLKEHLWTKAVNGKYEREFRDVKKRVYEMKKFSSFKEFVETISERKNAKMKEDVVSDLIRIYQKCEDLRPSVGIVLVMALWSRLVRLAPGEWFDDAYYRLFVEAETINPNEPEVIDRLMEIIRKRMRRQKCSDRQNSVTSDEDYLDSIENEEDDYLDSEHYLSFCFDWWSEDARQEDEEK